MGIKVQPSFVQLCISCFHISNLNKITQFSSSLNCTPATEPQKSLIIDFSQGHSLRVKRRDCTWALLIFHSTFKFFFFLNFYFILRFYLLILGCLLGFPFLVARASVPRVIKVYAAAEHRVSVIL